MSTERWHQIKSIVVRAMEASERERDEILSFECAGDPDLRAEVESLLDAARAADSLPEARAAIASATGSIVAEQDAALRSLLESVLSHQYEILRPIGRGGMGTVYLARERALDRFVAIKVLRPDLALAEGHRERFRREARIAARLSHPGILGLHSFGEIHNLWYFVMTYVRGETLGERIRREGALPWMDAWKIFVQIADALDCAHRNGVIHRDIKPANILLDSDSGHAILADFGISKMPGTSETITASGAILGTPVYMSPEQLAGGTEVDGRSDIYSLGIVAYMMLTGHEPFEGDSPAATIYRRLVDEPLPIETATSSIPVELSSIVTRCIARDKTNRWPDAGSLKAALDKISADERMPDLVRDVRSFGPYALLWAGGFAGLAILRDRPTSERALLIVAAMIAPLGLALHMFNGSRRGMRLSDVARPALYPPEWWTMWWPLSLRRPGDLWARLPGPARAVRLVITASFPALLLLILLREGVGSPAFGNRLDLAEWAILGVASAVVVSGLVWARDKQLTISQSLRLLLGDTLDSPRWSEAAFRRMLLPRSGKIRDPDAETPSDYLRAIRELLPTRVSMNGEAGLRACAAAEKVLKEIDQRDSELAKLARDAGPFEENRLASQLDGLESAGGETEESVELRDLVRHQLELVRRMRGRREIIMRDRAHLVDLLKGLWILVQACGDDHGEDSLEVNKLRALCADIRTELATAVA